MMFCATAKRLATVLAFTNFQELQAKSFLQIDAFGSYIESDNSYKDNSISYDNLLGYKASTSYSMFYNLLGSQLSLYTSPFFSFGNSKTKANLKEGEQSYFMEDITIETLSAGLRFGTAFQTHKTTTSIGITLDQRIKTRIKRSNKIQTPQMQSARAKYDAAEANPVETPRVGLHLSIGYEVSRYLHLRFNSEILDTRRQD